MRLVAANVIILGVLLVAMEGFASVAIVLYDIMTTSPLAERKHTQYDADLGWLNVPNVRIADLYGPGKNLDINSQGFRNTHSFTHAVPEGKVRVVCSGDSFTLGYGVDNSHAWCERLVSLDDRLETVNMGQGGYGVDQAYLWYRRDGEPFDHQIHILAFITDDFVRMASDRFYGYAKPVLKERDGMLVVENVPVPRGTYDLSWVTTQMGNLSQLRTVQFLRKALRKLIPIGRDANAVRETDTRAETQTVLRKIFEDLVRRNSLKGSRFLLVWFPVMDEVRTGISPEWRAFLEAESAAQGIPFINLFDDFQALPRDELPGLYGPDWHFTERGNEFVAKKIYERLRHEPSLSTLFSPKSFLAHERTPSP